MPLDFIENKECILVTLRREGPQSVTDLLKKLGGKRADIKAALVSLDEEHWMLYDRRTDRYGVRSRREREAVLAQHRLDLATADIPLHELLEMNDNERRRIARLSRAADEAAAAVWDTENNRIRDVDEPQADRI